MKLRNETTLIVGALGVGKTTLAAHAAVYYDKAVIITNFADDFHGYVIAENCSEIDKYGKSVFVSDDFIENEIAMRYAYELGDRLLIVDEAHLYGESEQLKKIVRYSRHRNLDIVLLSHSFFDFARTNRILIHNMILMRMTDEKGRGDPYEISYVERISPETKVREIGKYEFCFVKGDFPKWMRSEDYTTNGEFYKLKLSE